MYPLPHNSNHHYIVKYFTFRDASVIDSYRSEKRLSFADMYTRLVEEINNSTASVVILSAESMTLVGAEDLEKMRSQFPSFDLHIIMFYRNPLGWVTSMYRQELLDSPQRTPHSFTTYLLQVRGLRGSSLETYIDSFHKFVRVFGRDKVHIVDYDGFPRMNMSIMEAFFGAVEDAVGYPVWPSPPSNHTQENKGMLPQEMYVRQLWQLFDTYCRDKRGCTTFSLSNIRKMKARKLVEDTYLGSIVKDIPVKCLYVEMLHSYSLQLDYHLRQSLGDIIMYGDGNKSAELILSQRGVCQLDVDQVLTVSRRRWNRIFHLQKSLLTRNGLKCIRLGSANALL